MSNTIELNIEIDMEDKIVYIGEENSSGWEEEYANVEDIAKHIKKYIEMYHAAKIEKQGKIMEIKKNVDFIYEFLKEQNDTGYIDIEKLKHLQDNKFVVPGDTPIELQHKLDELLEKLWEELEDVPFEEDEGIEYLDDNYLDFEVGETSKEDIWHWFDDRHSKGIHYLLYGYEKSDNKKCIYYTEVSERISEENRDKDLFYYECRSCEGETTIERKVTVDFSGMFITSEDILGDKEYIDKEELFNNPQYELLDDSDIYDRVYESLNNDLEEDNEM